MRAICDNEISKPSSDVRFIKTAREKFTSFTSIDTGSDLIISHSLLAVGVRFRYTQALLTTLRKIHVEKSLFRYRRSEYIEVTC